MSAGKAMFYSCMPEIPGFNLGSVIDYSDWPLPQFFQKNVSDYDHFLINLSQFILLKAL